MAKVMRRRAFLKGLGAAGVLGLSGSAWGWSRSPNERLNLGVIGTANRAAANIAGVRGENIVAICDIDENLLGKAQAEFPSARAYRDFRKLVDHPGLDGIVVSTPDHTHAPATMAGIKRGLHVYCEKPLTHTVEEARTIAEAAKAKGVATQMGTQIHAGDNYRRVVELIRSGAIGPVREVHVWVGGKGWTGQEKPGGTIPVPENMHWDLWLGPADKRPYSPVYQPMTWRGWWPFGSGTMGDMACHHMDLPFWALDLRYPTKVTPDGPPVKPETTSVGLKVRYEHPAKGNRPAVVVTWYDGGRRPEEMRQPGMPKWGDGTLFVGDDGMLLAGYSDHVLLPEEKFRDYQRPEPSIPASIGHHAEWIRACKTGEPTTCNFDYSGALTEAVLLGVAAYRAGESVDWDGPALRATNHPERLENYLRQTYRKGWSLEEV